MERRTVLRVQFKALFIALLIIQPGFAPVLQAANVVDPDDAYPISRFGTSNAGDVFGGRLPASSGAMADPEEMRGRDEITNHRASHRALGTAPLGTVRRNGVQEVALIAGDLGFFPRTVFVTRDIPVRMFVTGASKNSLCILMDSFQVRKQVKSQKIEEVSFTPTQPGRFRFYCPINGAEGFMVVREFERADGG